MYRFGRGNDFRDRVPRYWEATCQCMGLKKLGCSIGTINHGVVRWLGYHIWYGEKGPVGGYG